MLVGCGLALVLCAESAVAVRADSGPLHVEGFEDQEPSWSVAARPGEARVKRHVRSAEVRHAGEAAELIEIEGLAPVSTVQLSHKIPPALLIDELTLSVWFHSPQDGVALSVRVVLPRQIDRRTGRPMTVLLSGGTYSKPGQWRRLICRELPKQLRSRLPQLRKSLRNETGDRADIDTAGAYVDRAVLTIQVGRQTSAFAIDDLRLEPIVAATDEGEVVQAAGAEVGSGPEAVVHMGQLLVRGQSYFPRIVPYHGEAAEELSYLRLNVAWIPDYQDGRLLSALASQGIRAMAIPPRPTATDGTPLSPQSAHLTSFTGQTAPILFWYLGTNIPPTARQDLMQWEEQVRSADQAFRRPVLGDVSGQERAYSKQLDMLGASRTPLHTTFGLKLYRDWLIERRTLAQPGSFLWTWIQTEPPPAVNRQREAAGWSPLVVEPEQIRGEVYAALAAGCRGIGYWTYSRLDAATPAARERRLAIAQLNMELELLEPWLATGTRTMQNPFKVQASNLGNLKGVGTPAGSNQDLEQRLNDRNNRLLLKEQLSRDLEAAMISTTEGLLVLPIWYGEEAQFVPGQMVANDARIVVPGGGESSRAFEISTTRIAKLDTRRVAGGTEILLKKFDQTAAILFTSDPAVIERLQERVNALSEASAQVSLELVRAKYERVVEVEQRIRQFGKRQADSGRILGSTKKHIDSAETALRNQQYHDSRTHSADALQLLRILQHLYWSDAVRRLPSPVSSPHTLCFQTLPDHWDMMARLGRAKNSAGSNALRSGDFEDFDTLVSEGIRHEETAIKGVQATAELCPRPHKGTYALRLIAAPVVSQEPPAQIDDRPVTVTTPPVTVYEGQLVYTSGWVKVAAPSLRNLDGVMLYDSIGGPATALRWRSRTEWQKFELVREVTKTGPFTLTLTLSGLGEVFFDDFQIIPIATGGTPESSPDKPPTRPGRPGALDFIKRIPGFGGQDAGGDKD
ncbi:MAG: hypothetical protein ACKV0T_17820 [Planctomycetales bacterium]